MIDAKTREAWRAQALQAARGIDRGQDEYACIALAESDPDYSGDNCDALEIVGLFTDAFQPDPIERTEYGMDEIAWLGSREREALHVLPDAEDAKVRVLALLFFREMLGTPGALSGPDFHLQA